VHFSLIKQKARQDFLNGLHLKSILLFIRKQTKNSAHALDNRTSSTGYN